MAATSIATIRATLLEQRAGMGRLSGPLLRKWRGRCAEAGDVEMVGVIDRELTRRRDLVGADVRAKVKNLIPWRE